MGSGGAAAPAHLIVHVGADGPASASLGGEPLAPLLLDRLSCDAAVQYVSSDPATGAVIDLGRSRRVPDPRLRAAVLVRDRATCTFPGCGRTRALHLHHLRHWAQGGMTDQVNLTALCGRHHHAVHEAGWRVRRCPDGQLAWTSPSGQTHTAPVAGWCAAPDPPWFDPPWPAARPANPALDELGRRGAQGSRPARSVHPSPPDLGDPPF